MLKFLYRVCSAATRRPSTRRNGPEVKKVLVLENQDHEEVNCSRPGWGDADPFRHYFILLGGELQSNVVVSRRTAFTCYGHNNDHKKMRPLA